MQWVIDLMTEWAAAQGYLTTSFVDRGDPADPDFELYNFTTDEKWYDLDLSSIVPDGAKAVLLTLKIVSTSASADFFFRKKTNSYDYNTCHTATTVAGIRTAADLVCPCSAERVIQYYGEDVVWTEIDLTVKGWWL